MGSEHVTREEVGFASQNSHWESLLEQLESLGVSQFSNPLRVEPSADWHSAFPAYSVMVSEREELLTRVEELMKSLEIATEALMQSNANCRRLQGILEDVSDGLSQVAHSFWAKPIKSNIMGMVARAQRV